MEYIHWISEEKDNKCSEKGELGGKGTSLDKMYKVMKNLDINIPLTFIVKSNAYNDFISSVLSDINQIEESNINLPYKVEQIHSILNKIEFSDKLLNELKTSWTLLDTKYVAARSSATSEDSLETSFAGQYDTVLNISNFTDLLSSIKQVYKSVFNECAISYRKSHGIKHVSMAVCVQQMVQSETSGVMFTVCPESGFNDTVSITSSYGLGELLVSGTINPDEFMIYKPTNQIIKKTIGSKLEYMKKKKNINIIKKVRKCKRNKFSLSDIQIIKLGHIGIKLENYYGHPLDIEWGMENDQFYILQARPITVNVKKQNTITKYVLMNKGPMIVSGIAIGQMVGCGTATIIQNTNEPFEEGNILVTDMTSPGWEPLMKKSAAIVTNKGGRTCHAAIIARELGIPAVIGCHDATQVIRNGQCVTVSCAEGDIGYVYHGLSNINKEIISVDVKKLHSMKIMMNINNPNMVYQLAKIPNDGVGLARLEFIINNTIGIHPRAILDYQELSYNMKKKIDKIIVGYPDPVEFYWKKLAQGIASMASAFHPNKVIIRFSDFKSNEYKELIGGDIYELDEENPMIGFRGASRYVASSFKDCFELECRAVKYVREVIGLKNVEVMIPFVRTLNEIEKMHTLLAEFGLERGIDGLRVIMMCEVPSNVILADEFLEYVDGFSIGSNDLTQLTLGIDRDSHLLATSFNEQDPAVLKMIKTVINKCLEKGKYIGICGQGPSDSPEFAKWLYDSGIESMSLNPDTVVPMIQTINQLMSNSYLLL